MKENKAPSLGRTPAQKFLDKWQGLIYLIPWIIGFIVFKAIPFGQSLYYSFTDMNFFNGIHQYGVMNYVTAFSDAKVTKALVTTFKYAFITVPLKLIFALFIAYILNFKIACVNLFRTVYYIPSILGGSVAIAVIDGLVFRNVEMHGVKAPFVINMFYFCDPDGHSPYVQCRDAMPVDEYTPKLGSLTMEDIVATDAQFAGCYFDGLPEQPIERISMKNVTITFDPNAEAGQAAMADNRPNVKKLAIYAENVKEIDLHNVKITGYEGERLRFANVGHFEED